jgi:type I restriction enzyme S subunit
VTRKNAESKLEARHIETIPKAYRERTNDGVFAYDATNDEIAAKDWSLAISLYAHRKQERDDAGEARSLKEALGAYAQSATDAEASLARLQAAVAGRAAAAAPKAARPFHPAANLPQGTDRMRRVKFGDIAINSIAKKKPTEADAAHYIGLEHIDPGSFVVSRWGGDVAPIGDKLVMKKGDLLFGKRRAYQRKVAIAPFDGIFSAHGMVLRPKKDVIDERYFPFFIASDQFMDTAVRISVGGLSPTINWKTLRECEFSLPPLDRQRELAELLWAANDLKEAYKKALAATDEMLKAKFREVFEAGPSMGWPTKKMSDVFEISSSRRILKESWGATGIPFLRVRDMVALADNEELHNEFFVTEEFYNGLTQADGKPLPGDILVSATSTIGKCYVVKEGERFYYKDADVWRFRKKTNIDSHYFMYALSMPALRKQIELSVGATTVGHFLICKAQGLTITLPPITLQHEFVAIAEAAEETKAALKRSLGDLEQVMKGLING